MFDVGIVEVLQDKEVMFDAVLILKGREVLWVSVGHERMEIPGKYYLNRKSVYKVASSPFPHSTINE